MYDLSPSYFLDYRVPLLKNTLIENKPDVLFTVSILADWAFCVMLV